MAQIPLAKSLQPSLEPFVFRSGKLRCPDLVAEWRTMKDVKMANVCLEFSPQLVDMNPSTSRPLTPRRRRTLALRESLERQILRQTQEFSPPIPPDPPATSSCRIKKIMCYGRGEDFDNIGRWTAMCVKRDHTTSTRSCTKIQMLTPKLLDWQLDVLRALWVRYDHTGKKWGKQDVPEDLLAPIASLPPPIPSAPRVPTASVRTTSTAVSNHAARKRKRSPSPTLPRHVPVRFIDLKVIDLTVPAPKKRRIGAIDSEVIDLTD
ncbi:hypothetical protein DFH09DRAFT_1104449 [Mycena vulgaris]|nr:hypothetical protein DFH09DRAFT_1110686 [Mycena vulgaris]KAJ6493773.1 hypothetical protein DFH09DRAFT_1104449 [Mycena vulgaris]